MKKSMLIICSAFALNMQSQIITTVAGNRILGYSGDGGMATAASLNSPTGIATDQFSNIYIADMGNNVVRKVSTTGVISTIAGNGTAGFSGDGGQAIAAQIDSLEGLALDMNGNLYIADYNNNRVRKVSTTGIITTVAGNGIAGYSGDGGIATAGELNHPAALTLDALGNLFIVDYMNSVIRKVNTLGIITTAAGGGTSGLGDGGQATDAELNSPIAVNFDATGNLYICDEQNFRLRKVNTAGIITTLAGNGGYGFHGDGGMATAAELSSLDGVVIDPQGNIYLVDNGNNRIRVINNSGIINTIIGGSAYGYSGNGGLASLAEISVPAGIAIDNNNNLFIVDQDNYCIRKVSPPLTLTVNSPAAVCAGVTTTLTASGANTYSWTPSLGLSTTTGSVVIASPSVTTIYTVFGTKGDSMGLATSTVTINSIVVNSTSICLGNTTTLTALGATTCTWSTGSTSNTIIVSPIVTTTYTLSGYSSTCTSSASSTVTINPIPTVSFTLNQDTIPHTWDVNPTYATNTFYAYWTWGDGSGTYGLYPSHTFSVAGTYSICVTATDTLGCNATYCINDSVYRLAYNSSYSGMVYINVKSSATGIQQIKNNNEQVTIYPNPANGIINLKLGIINGTSTLQITDMLGNTVKQSIIYNSSSIISVSDLAEGVYTISISSNEGVVNKRLVIVR